MLKETRVTRVRPVNQETMVLLAYLGFPVTLDLEVSRENPDNPDKMALMVPPELRVKPVNKDLMDPRDHKEKLENRDKRVKPVRVSKENLVTR